MTLHVRSFGAGPDIVLLHGWGLHSGIWSRIAASLSESHRVHLVDLPGHGGSRFEPRLAVLDDWAHCVARRLPDACALVGWSLGGLIAQRLALLFPQRLRSLVLVSTTPRFVAGRDWHHGMKPAVLENFAQRLQADYRATVEEFLALQVRGEEHALATLRELRGRVLSENLPDPRALSTGLEILRLSDLRQSLHEILQPALVITGDYDRVTPPGAGEQLAASLPDARLHVVRRAGHAPFVSHADEFLAVVGNFLAAPHTGDALAGATP